ncbi:hypothetical protein MMC06_001451 [Schaereria dolodes]|nr:hypothetical protein [Schaereria dolodes]
MDIRIYEQMLQEGFSAQRERRAMNFTPICSRERVPMSPKDFWKLYEALNLGEIDYQWPSLSYNSHSSIAIIDWMSSGVHEPLAATFIEQFGVAKAFLSPANRKQLAIVGAQEVGSFQGSYQSSSKEPDALFVYPPPNGPISYTCAVEVGFSERYEDLVEDIRLWIEGARMRMVILINVDEAPRYRCPTYGLQDDEIEDLELPAIRALNTSMVSLEDKTDRFGPLQMHGLTWVNKMNAFLEIWKPDGITGEAKQEGDRKVFVGADYMYELAELDIRFSDLYPIADADGGNQRFPVTWEQLRFVLERGRMQLAVRRCCKMLVELKNRTDAIDDPDYIA